MDYILNPIYLTIYFATDDDFITKGKRNYVYFFINFFIAIITLLGFIFNEFIIIFYFGLEKETHQEISRRASSINETEILAMYDIDDDEEEKKFNLTKY